MKIAVTGGTGFVGRRVVARLRAAVQAVAVLGHGDAVEPAVRGCDAVVHCAGINREIGSQTYAAVHVAVDDVARILVAAALGDERLARRTFAVLGPEELLLSDAVRRVAAVVGRRPLFVALPISAQRVVAIVAELLMAVPLISRAQVRILAEGIVEPLPAADPLPVDLLPTTRFDEASIRAGLPPAGGFGRADLRWCRR